MVTGETERGFKDMKYFTKATLMILFGLAFIVGSGCGGGSGSSDDSSVTTKSYSIAIESIELIEPNGTAIVVDGLPLQGREVEMNK